MIGDQFILLLLICWTSLSVFSTPIPKSYDSKRITPIFDELDMYIPTLIETAYNQIIENAIHPLANHKRPKEFNDFSKELHSSLRNHLIQPIISSVSSTIHKIGDSEQDVLTELALHFQTIAVKKSTQWEQNDLQILLQKYHTLLRAKDYTMYHGIHRGNSDGALMKRMEALHPKFHFDPHFKGPTETSLNKDHFSTRTSGTKLAYGRGERSTKSWEFAINDPNASLEFAIKATKKIMNKQYQVVRNIFPNFFGDLEQMLRKSSDSSSSGYYLQKMGHYARNMGRIVGVAIREFQKGFSKEYSGFIKKTIHSGIEAVVNGVSDSVAPSTVMAIENKVDQLAETIGAHAGQAAGEKAGKGFVEEGVRAIAKSPLKPFCLIVMPILFISIAVSVIIGVTVK